MQNITIKTAQNVSVEYELASLRERVTAFMIDFVVVLLAYMLLVLLIINAASGRQGI
ncbi:MAG: RDD family protein, partial [Saprospiraceae bacterium]|nr:RDD family protein [Saprospiraceae bacterium]